MARKKKEETSGMDSKDLLKSHLDSTKENHFNYDAETELPKSSSGSLLVDLQLNGGFEPCIIRPVGNTQSGKTASTLEHLRIFLSDESESRKGLYIKSEGRLSKSKRESSGVKFVSDPQDWEDGTCFILKTNIYEDVINLLRELIRRKNNIPYTRYWFIFDSMDGLIGIDDFEKKAEDAVKVAGGALLTSTFLKNFSLYMHETGHYASMIGQMRSSGPQNPYGEKSQKVGSASGGNAIQHYADWIFEYYPANKYIFDDYSVDGRDPKKKIIGHYARFIIKKGDKDERDIMVEYPILYGRKGGAVFKELEIVDVGFYLNLFIKKGAWITFDDSLKMHCASHNITLPETIQGQRSLIQLIMDSPDLAELVYKYIYNILQSMKS